ncbi:acyl-phosphate:glycerol-3-phosphate O-acyltransferase PlsY [Dehalogenimonas sp. WBC-2]|nr:acyl-phosphate:glycerol-3-phosphate O-acyltransferase PlsY [Dehalogenimonas sp. WBC-2]
MTLLLVIAAYLIGSIPIAYIIARWTRGVDLRKFGSGNVGSSNALKATSKRWALPVVLFDFAKGLLAVWVARWAGLETGMQMVVGIAAITGQIWPLFLGFRGGRGNLTSLGVVAGVSPLLGLVILAIALSLSPLKKLSLSVFIGFLSLPLLAYYLSGFFNISEPGPVAAGFAALTTISLGRRLIGRRSELATGLSTGELITNRLLFDRDIRDRKTWISRPENSSKALS